MADNINVTPGTGKTVAADEIAGALHQRVKISLGADGAAADLAPGQAVMASSVPVVIASNQSAVPVSGSVAITGGLTDAELRATPVPVSDGGGSLTVDGPLTDAQLRAADVKISLDGETVPVTDNGGSLTVDGTVAISGAVAVTGPLTDAQLRAAVVPVSDGAGSLTVDGTVAVTGALTDTELRATPVPVSASNLDVRDLTSTDVVTVTGGVGQTGDVKVTLDGEAVPVTDNGGSLTVDGTVAVSGSVAVTGPLTDAQLRAAVVPVSDGAGSLTVDGTVTVQDGGGSLTVDGPLTDTELRATPVPVADGGGSLTVDGTVAVSGSVAVTGPLTDAQLRAAVVPISDGAGSLTVDASNLDIRDLTSTDVVTVTGGIGQAADVKITLDGETVPVTDNGGSLTVDGTVAVSGSVAVTGPLTDAQLRAAVVPVSDGAGSLTVDGTITANLAAGVNNIGDVDVLTLPALPAGDNNIGNVDVVSSTLPTGAATEATLASIKTAVEILDNIVAGSEAQVDIVSSALPTGAATESTLASIKTAVELIDNMISGSEAQVDVVTQPVRARTTDHIGAADTTDAIMNGLTALTPKFAVIDAATSGDNTLVAAVNPKKIRVLALFLVSAGTVNARFESGAGGTALTGQMNLVANTGFVLPYNPLGWFETASNTLLNLELSAAISVDGSLTYVEV